MAVSVTVCHASKTERERERDEQTDRDQRAIAAKPLSCRIPPTPPAENVSLHRCWKNLARRRASQNFQAPPNFSRHTTALIN